MKWCCDGLKHAFEKRKGRTLFVFAVPPEEQKGNPSFWLGMRSVEQKDLQEMNTINLPDNLKVTISTKIPIHYCPWCGKRLISFYRKNYDILVDQALLKEFFSY